MKIICGDSLEVLKRATPNSVDSIVTDPPYGISFMGKKWDYDVPSVEVWKECLRVLKPGGHALVACGTRTQHRMAVNLEDGGFEIRDIVAWIYGSGFPKSHNIGKAVDKLQGNERDISGIGKAGAGFNKVKGFGQNTTKGGEATTEWEETKGNSKYEGWGTALKPDMELWTLCRKPLEEKTVASNVLKYGTGGINIDECRVGSEKIVVKGGSKSGKFEFCANYKEVNQEHQGRFPANLIHSGEDEVVEGFPESKARSSKRKGSDKSNMFGFEYSDTDSCDYADKGSASRFFYCAKASKSERNQGLEEFEEEKVSDGREKEADNAFQRGKTMRANTHPTIKPIKLMQYLVRLITPKGGTVLDPYIGSGSTGIGAKLEGFDFIGIEREQEYCDIAEARIKSYDL